MPLTSRIRRQGGAAIVTLPPAILRELRAEVGSHIELEVHDGELVARPVAHPVRRRYTLRELLQGAEHLIELNRATALALEGDAAGRELS